MSLMTKVLAAILLILLLISAGFNVYQIFENHSLNTTITQLNKDKKTAEANLAACKAGVDQSNKDVLAEQKKAQDKQTELDTLGKTLADQQAKNKALIDKMSAQPAPKTCDEAKEYIKQNLENLKW